ncbi:MAG: tRNA lysidine(34) synthetase TilS [Eubacteriales bacterium]|nr:tRNA lysidine(34) synthetase TilS [Eubacteriales bacterium]
MNKKILKTVERYNMLSYGDRVVAAVSGGADSMLMLNFLLSVREKYNLDIICAHVEHGIRGQESIDDAEFVKQFCIKNDIEFKIKHIDAVNESKTASKSVEEYSREKRYEFFCSIDCDKIATAHNLTDNAETVLFRLARETGLKGMCGIPAVRDKIIRPLIEIPSSDIREYCSKEGIKYRTDSTNSCNDYSRNIIRNEILPLFSKLNSSCEDAINSFISDANEDYCFIEKSADLAYKECLYDNKLLTDKLLHLDIAIAKRVILRYFKNFGVELDRNHLESIYKIVSVPSKVQIKGNVFAVSNSKYLRIANFTAADFVTDFDSQILNIDEFNGKNIDFYCDYDKIIGSVYLRKRQDGDAVKPAGRGCTKTLKKLFNELSVPVEKRDSIPVICDSSGVIGIYGICADERVRVDGSTQNVFVIKLPSED